MARGKYHKWLTDDGLLTIESWARDGLVDEQIAQKMGITRATFYDWAKRFPDISDALKKGKAPIDAKVENALLKRALGHEYYDEEIVKDGDKIRKRRVKRTVIPDVSAQIFWLKNRKPEVWRKASPVFEAKVIAETEKLQAENERLRLEIERLRDGEGVTVTENKIAEFFEKLGEEIDDS